MLSRVIKKIRFSIRKKYSVNEKYVNYSSFVIVLSVNYVILDMFFRFLGDFNDNRLC